MEVGKTRDKVRADAQNDYVVLERPGVEVVPNYQLLHKNVIFTMFPEQGVCR